MASVNREVVPLERENLNDMDRWILEFLSKHEWATPNLLREYYNDEQTDKDSHVSRQWISQRITRLREHGHIEKVHPNASEYQLVDDPRERE